MDNLEERETSERKAGLACRETKGEEVPKETEDLLVMPEKQPSYPGRETQGMLGLLEIMGSQEEEVIKEAQDCKGEEEILEEMDYPDSTEGSLG